MQSGERDYEHVWLLVEDSLNTRCEQLSFLIFLYWNFQTQLFEILLFVQYKLVVLLNKMLVMCFILKVQLYYAIQKIFTEYAIANHKFPNEYSDVIFIQTDQHWKMLLNKYKGVGVPILRNTMYTLIDNLQGCAMWQTLHRILQLHVTAQLTGQL